MGLETGTYIQDLNENNPISGDPVAEGDNHLRLIKSVLKATFPTATRSMPTPTAIYRPVGTYNVTVAQEHTLFLMDTTSGQVNLTMPSLSGAQGGWECSVMKISWNLTAGFIFPPGAGTIQSGERLGLPYTRRCIPGMPTRVMWTGSNWHCSRVPSVPVGTVLPYQGGDLPVGYEWPNSQALNTGLYPEFAQVRGGGVTMDHRGRVPAMADQGAGRLGAWVGGAGTNTGAGGVNSGAYGGEGGTYIHSLHGNELAAHTHPIAIYDPGHSHSYTYNVAGSEWGPGDIVNSYQQTSATGAGTTGGASWGGIGRIAAWDGTNFDVSFGAGANYYHNNVQPTVVEHFILVVE